MGQRLLKKHSKFQILLRQDWAQERDFICFYMSVYKNHFKKRKCGTESV